jgi:hypothetical protein
VRRAALLLGAAAIAYAAAAWAVPPGFYDGFQNVTPYRWVSPPPSLRAGNQPPLSGHATDPAIGSSGTAPLTAFTGDGQMVVSFVPGAFQLSPGQSAVTIDIKPATRYPALSFTPATNIYLVTASASLAKEVLVELQYSNMVPAPSYVYEADQSGGPWRNLGSSQVSAIYTISTRTSKLGYFAAGYPSRVKPPSGAVQVGGGQVLPIVVAAVILLVLVAGVPLVLLRRGRDEEGAEDPRDRE